MKKFAILAIAALLVVAFTVPAAAFENQFGGYWRTRFYINKKFSGRRPDRKPATGRWPTPVPAFTTPRCSTTT